MTKAELVGLLSAYKGLKLFSLGDEGSVKLSFIKCL